MHTDNTVATVFTLSPFTISVPNVTKKQFSEQAPIYFEKEETETLIKRSQISYFFH